MIFQGMCEEMCSSIGEHHKCKGGGSTVNAEGLAHCRKPFTFSLRKRRNRRTNTRENGITFQFIIGLLDN